ncbi:hypothetical protein BV898_05717 [Hypsibius exemplaris]|uniref:RanBP2-type domain-containing protein n=1 Tax=Hypsibius exemplaris TaxID=2072580 RepID=A0A1W0WY96_HYPEX|nr:hypothetical protein BV898_05717 [Hypsibius exemplaris]
MDHEDELQEGENAEQWNYLDGTPAKKPEEIDAPVPRPGFIEQTVSSVTNFLNVPFGWWRRKPSAVSIRASASSRPPIPRRNHITTPPPALPMNGPTTPDHGRPPKRQRAAGGEYGRAAREEIPPNVDFLEDERPSPALSSSASYMTEDEDSDAEMSAPSTSTGQRGRKLNAIVPARSTAPLPRTPLTERRDLTSAPPPRRNSLLPLIQSAKKSTAVVVRHPLEQQSKFTSGPITPSTASRKRNFDAVDIDESASGSAASPSAPKLFSTFPKSTERASPVVPSLARFSAFKSVAAPSVSQRAAPYYATKRYDLLNQSSSASTSRSSSSRSVMLPPMAPLPPLLAKKPYLQASQIPIIRRDAVKLDYSYVVPAIKATYSTASGGSQDFIFQSTAIVPSGAVKKALERYAPPSDRDSSESRQSSRSPSVRLCPRCGISIRPGDLRCDVCERVEGTTMTRDSGDESGDSAVVVSATLVRKPQPPRQEEVFDVDDETWRCSLCDKENTASTPSCKSCGRAKKVDGHHRLKATLPTSEASLRAPASSSQVGATEQQAAPPKPRVLEDTLSRGGEPAAKRTHVEAEEQPKTSTTSPVTAQAAPPPPPVGFVDIWSKTAAGKTWSCPTCMCSNPESLDKCPACETQKPGTVAKPKESSLPTISSSLFGGFQPATTATAVSKADTAVGASSSGGFTFGVAKPNDTAATGLPAVTAPVFSFGGLPKPSDGQAPITFTGFGGLGGQTNGIGGSTAPKPAASTTATATTGLFSGLSNGSVSSSFVLPTPQPAAGSAPASGIPVFGSHSASASNAATGAFRGFASNTIIPVASSAGASTTAAPTVSTSSFGSGIPTFAGATTTGTKLPANFSFGQSTAAGATGAAAAPPAFGGFGALNGGGGGGVGAGAAPVFSFGGGLNGSSTAPQSNGIPGSTGAASSLFGGGGFGTFQAAAPLENGQNTANLFPSGLPQPGTFGLALQGPPGSIGAMGTASAPRRVIKAKRNLARNV